MRGIDIAKEIIDNNISGKVLVIGDPDIDGMIAFKFLRDYFQRYRKVELLEAHLNDNRQHGFMINPEDCRGYLIVSADFAMTYDEIKTVVDCGANIVCTDHHEVQDEFIDYSNNGCRGIVINNQYPFEDESMRYDSGAGVIYTVLKALTPEFETEERDCMVGITLLSDIRPIENNKARSILHKLYNNREGYIEYLVEMTHKTDYTFGEPRMDRTYVDFTFSPTINAMLRFNKTYEARILIDGFGMIDRTDYRQMQKELIERMKSVAEVMEMEHMIAIGVNDMFFQEDITNFIGLLCMRYNAEKSVLGFVHSGKKVTRASFRGRYSNLDYNKKLRELGVESAGHKSAFGIKNFRPKGSDWQLLDKAVEEVESNAIDTRKIIETENLSVTLGNKGMNIAHDNCFVRTSHRTYIRYKGSNFKLKKATYKMRELTNEEIMSGIKPDKVVKGAKCVIARDSKDMPIVKYQEYVIDNKVVKSFGVSPMEGLIMPIMERGYIYLYLV